MLASALGMDKHFTKTVLQQAGIAVAPWMTVTAREWADAPPPSRNAAARAWAAGVRQARPCRLVASASAASRDWSQLAAAMDVALAEDDKVLIEAGIVGREVECGVLEGRDRRAPPGCPSPARS